MHRKLAFLYAALTLAGLSSACAGGAGPTGALAGTPPAAGGPAVSGASPASDTAPAVTTASDPAPAGATAAATAAADALPASAAPSLPAFRGDDSRMLAFGGWAWGNVPADAVAHAGFDWFETGYPGDTATNQTLLAASIRPFAYINLGELDPTLQTGYTGPILRMNTDWGTSLVDVTDPSWQDWLIRRTDFAYDTGSRGVKWDVATPDVPPGKSRGDVNAAIASIMQRILQRHPEMKFIFNQGFEFADAYPQYVHAIETEGLFSAASFPAAFLQPWLDPYYWGALYTNVKAAQQRGIRVFCAEYADPFSDTAKKLYDAIVAEGFVPYVTSDQWNIRGRGYNVAPGW